MRFGFSNTSASSALTRVISIVSNVNDYNLYNALIATGWDGTKRLKVFVTINSGVTVGSTSTSTPAFTVGNLRDTDYVEIINNGNIFGAGGAGGVGAATSNGGVGARGGPALKATSNVRIINNGIIGGGGGGNGANGASRSLVSYTPSCPSGGTLNGGVVAPPSTTCGWCAISLYNYYAATCTPNYSYPAGANGAVGTAGSGSAGTAGTSPWYAGGEGGAAGYYYEGTNKITVITAGTARGNTLA